MIPDLKASDFDFDLPKELIAQHPLERRDDSRLMIVRTRERTIEHARFNEFPGFLEKGDALVLNDTKVIPARVWGRVGDRPVEFLFIKERAAGQWEVICRPAKRVRTGEGVVFGDGFKGCVTEEGPEGLRTLSLDASDVLGKLKTYGFAPLPPYIKRGKDQAALRPLDLDRYQTVYARHESAIAAPTAGLHFTGAVLEDIKRRGVEIANVTLEVGLATFQPLRVERLAEHKMLEESYRVSCEAAGIINRAKGQGRPISAVGTTVVRTLESAFQNGSVRAEKGATSLFIHPGYEFKIVDRLLTNFHLPRSTLLMLVAAFAGYDLIMRAYREAVKQQYRFFSYGDCMLIL